MTQICCNITEQEYEEIVRQAEALKTTKGARAAELITYALTIDRVLDQKDAQITQLQEEVGFLRSEVIKNLQPLTKLLTEPKPKKHWWQRS